MNQKLDMDNIELRVLLLAIYTKRDDDSFNDVLKLMENSKVFDIKTGKKYLLSLKEFQLINDKGLTFLGVQKAKEVEKEFKL